MKIYLAKPAGQFSSPMVVVDRDNESREWWAKKGYVQLSDVIDVEFPMLTRDQVAASEIAALDGKRAEVVEEFTKKLHAIDERKSQLLAIGPVSS